MIKKLFTYLIIAVLLVRIVSPVVIFAEDITPTPTPEETNTAQIDNNNTTDNGVDSNADTGNNAINPTPTPGVEPASLEPTPEPTVVPENTDPVPSPTPIESGQAPDPGVTVTNSADVTNSTDSTAITGENSITADSDSSSQPESTDESSSQNSSSSDSTIQTGDALSTAAVENSVNTTNINSEVINQTINLFVTEDGSLDLSDPFTIISGIIPDHLTDPVINVSVVSVNNYSYLSNDIVSFANTGNNQINSDGTAVIDTGNAYSMVSLLNQVNFTIINSQIHLLTINIFGNLNGNIILPDSTNQSQNCDGCGINLAIDNQANVENNIDSTAISGQNSITATDSGEITTGDAKSSVSNINIVNTNLVGVNALVLYINNLGYWDGNFLGWGNFDPQSGGASLMFYQIGPASPASQGGPNGNGDGCPGCVGSLSIQNNATVLNNVSSSANTGGNNINAQNGTINTGRAFSAVSIFNFVNSTFINSKGFFGFINIFGKWKGDIGGKSNFAQEEPVIEEAVSSEEIPNDTNDDSSPSRDSGGLLSVTQSNNAGEYVMPGDTVTFFANIKNTGNGRVYDTKLDLFLIKDGENVGGATFNLGDIGIGKQAKLSTGLVLSKSAPAGEYIARAVVRGTVGPENSEVTASSDSFFDVFDGSFAAAAINNGEGLLGKDKLSVLGAVYKDQNTQKQDMRLLTILAFTLLGYTVIRALRGRDNLARVFSRRSSLHLRLQALRMFLL